ncbi:acid protease [Sistotremastrum niveocremeum HHB9708]|uniref:Acid protease n=2 Tax=Sistotremastraceae TaxID=3402574 RepID=A0A164NVS4_9AGAM|nr:acid protease [Sistotremastrum niveocremeum HHB9708]KZT40486.1 acid protease [Sistotremastrum suecicum HHB10207 ss-3]
MHHHTKAVSAPLHRNKAWIGKSPSGFAAYARAARKFNFDAPTVVGNRGQVFRKTPSGGTGSEVPAEDVQGDLEYVVPVTIGTPGVTLDLDFDTGSSDLWVWSSELKSGTKGHNVYNPSKSSTAKVLKNAKWNISYGDGSSASGNVYTDTVKIGTVTIPSQAVELAEKLSSQFASGEGSDGLLGLAWPALNTVTPSAQKTPVENLIDDDVISQGVFTVALDKGDSNGFYTFGTIDAAKAGVSTSDIKYTPVDNSQGFWMFDSATATVNGQTINRSGNTAIADTGTTLCLVDDNTVQSIYSQIEGAQLDNSQGGYVYPSDAQIPVVQFAVGDNLFTVDPADFAFSDAGNGMTFGGIQSRGDNPFDILGDVFLKSVYVVFDQSNVQIGMAQRS